MQTIDPRTLIQLLRENTAHCSRGTGQLHCNLLYVGFDGNDSEIYTINASGGGKRQLTDNDTGDFYPSYSPSGKRIAFVNDAGADREIYTIKPNGGSAPSHRQHHGQL